MWRTGLIGLAALFLAACSPEVQEPDASAPPASTAAETEPSAWDKAISKALEASDSTQSAQSTEDWETVADLWEEAIALMREVPANSPQFPEAGQKVIEYQSNAEYAKGNAIPELDAETKIALYGALMRDVDPEANLILEVKLKEGTENTAQVIVDEFWWEAGTLDDRKAFLDAWDEGWANIHGDDSARLEIRAQNESGTYGVGGRNDEGKYLNE